MPKPKKNQLKPRVSRLYRTGTIIYLVLAFLLAAFILAQAFAYTTITVLLSQQPLTKTQSFSLIPPSDQSSGESELPGVLLKESAEGSTTREVASTGATVDDYAQGAVTIYNNWTKVQPLAIRTRLKASSNSLIYRTTKRVDVPPGGTVEVEVVADEAGAKGNIGPDSFEIVALWQGLKDKIYAKSSKPMTGGTRSSSTLSQALIDEASEKLQEELIKKLPSQKLEVPHGMVLIPVSYLMSSGFQPSAKAGDQAASVTVSGKVTSVFPAVESTAMRTAVENMLQEALPKDHDVLPSEPSLSWKIIRVNEQEKRADLELTVTHSSKLKTTSELLQPARFTSKTKEAILRTLRGTPGVQNASVSISPFWVFKTQSRPSQIRVQVNVEQ